MQGDAPLRTRALDGPATAAKRARTVSDEGAAPAAPPPPPSPPPTVFPLPSRMPALAWGEPHTGRAPDDADAVGAAPDNFGCLLPGAADSAGVPPHPAPPPPGAALLDLNTATDAELRAAAAATAPPPLPPVPLPPVPDDKRGLPSGAAAAARRRARPGSGRAANANDLLKAYIDGAAPDVPWHALGAGRAPIIGGRPLDLRGLWTRSRACGGYEATVAAKRWASIATAMGMDCKSITNAGWLVRTHYQRFLLPLELEMREAGTYTAGGAPVPDERPGSAGRTAAVSGVDPGVGDAV